MSDRPTLKINKPKARTGRDPQRRPVRAANAPSKRLAAGRPAARGDDAMQGHRPAGAPQETDPRPRPPGPRYEDRPRPQWPRPDERPREPRPFDDRPRGPRPFDDRPREPRPFDSHPREPRPFDERAREPRPFDDRPQRSRPLERPPDAPPARAGGIAPQGVRLSKVLAERGMASRREADDWIDAGWVRVDGKVAVLGQRIGPEQRIDIDPRAHGHQAMAATFLLHKPVGHVSGQPEDGHPPAVELITEANHWPDDPVRRAFHRGLLRGLAPAGRLDIDSTGLLVLTQDGRVARHLIGEDSAVEKEYLVRVVPAGDVPVPEGVLDLLRHGLALDGVALKPAQVSWANEDQLRMVLREGRKRQIRRMCELVGLQVVGLKRVRIGRIPLGKLPAGQWRWLGPFEKF